MKHFKKILFPQNKARQQDLELFRDKYVEYSNSVRYDPIMHTTAENQTSWSLRTDLNHLIDRTNEMLLASGIDPTMRIVPPPAVGGMVRDINVIENLFLVQSHGVKPENVVDFLNRALGKYQEDYRSSIFRTFNPFFYFFWLIESLSRVPFIFLGNLGFSSNRAENSVFGRIVKGLIQLTSFAASIGTILQVLNINVGELLKGFVK